MNSERWHQIKRLYNAALELEADQRESFLKGACAGDLDLQQEIQRLLAQQREAEDLMEQPAIEAAAKALARDEVQEHPADLLGQTVAHFHIVEKIGAGGMGEVYQAKDLTLGRNVAIKILPEEFARDTDRVARFQREAKLLAALNHTNIAAIHGLEKSGGINFLVLELVEGETLADQLKRGPIPVEESLKLALQIAEALEAAHEKGVIHRDLKLANIKVTPDGKVKVLDFGLAKAFAGEQADVNLSNSPTLSMPLTQQGVILGTAAYMSPEQARGKAVDKRADIWAFGVVLFEMLTGQQLFRGNTVSDILASVLKEEPDWKLLPQDLPANIRSVLQRCLQRDLKLRYHDIADVRLDIEAPSTHPSKTAVAHRRFSIIWPTVCAAGVLLLGILIIVAVMRYSQPAKSSPVLRSAIKVEPGHWLAGMALGTQRPTRTAMAISSDGSFVVYSAIEENTGPQAKVQLYLRRMDQAEAKPITGTEGGFNPFLSPDDRWVGFCANQKLKKVPVDGGVPTTLCDIPFIFGASWGPDNSIVFADRDVSGLSRVSADGGKPESLTTPDPKREEFGHRLPSWLPNGKAVLFTVMRNGKGRQPSLALLRLDTREWHVLLQDAADARYIPTGHLVFLSQGTLMAVQFNPAKLEIIGQPSPLIENVLQTFAENTGWNTGAGQFSVSNTGALIYAAGGILPESRNSLVWVDRSGTEQAVTPLQMPFFAPRLSPDGQRITYVTLGRERQVYVYDLNTGTNSRLTAEGSAGYPIWTPPDGKRITFSWQKSAASNLFSQPSDVSSPMERLTTSQYMQYPGSWSPNGQTLALVESHADTGSIILLEARSGHVRTFLNSQFNEMYPEFSPDGRWIAYSSNESKRYEVYVQPFPGPGIKHQVSSQGGIAPLWARNGKQLFYGWPDQMWVVDVKTDGGFATGKPRKLFERPGYSMGTPIRSYDLSQDGQRFLMVKLEQRKPTPVT
jgi:eukaryotic-like serine/threonine-protein kinase